MSASSGRSASGLGTIFLIVLLDLIGFGIVIPQLGVYGCKLEASPFAIGLLMSVYSLMQLIFAPILGRLSDRVGRKPVLLLSLLGSVVGYVLFAFAPSLSWLFASRIIDGISGGNLSTAQAYIADVTSAENRAKGMGMVGAAFGLGFILGPALGGLLGRYGGNLAIGLGSALMSTLAMVLTLATLKEPPRDARKPAEDRSLSFVGRALKLPIVNLTLVLMLVFTTAFSMMEGTFSLFLVVRHLHHGGAANEAYACALAASDRSFVERASALAAWIFVAVGVIATVVQGGLIGPLKKRFGEPRLVIFGCAATAVGLMLVPLMPTYLWLFFPTLFLAGGSGLLGPSLSALASLWAPEEEQGEILGSYQAFGSLGRVLGPALGGAAFSLLGSGAPYAFSALMIALCVPLAVSLKNRVAVRARPSA